jgi:hypothetical protein
MTVDMLEPPRNAQTTFFFKKGKKPQPLHQSDAYGFMHRPDNMPSIMFVDIIDIFLAAKGCTTQDKGLPLCLLT